MLSTSIKKVLITGASGLIGSHLLRIFADNNKYDVVGFYHSRLPVVEAKNIRHIREDLTRPTRLSKEMKDADIVYALAGVIDRRPKNNQHHSQNVCISLNTLDAAISSGIKKVVFISSSTAYPNSNYKHTEADMFLEEPPAKNFLSGWTIRYLEKIYESYFHSAKQSVDVVILRPTAIYGEFDDFSIEKGHVLASTINRVVTGDYPIKLWGGPQNSRDYIYAGDVALACFKVLHLGKGFNIYNIGTGISTTVEEMVNKVLGICKASDAQVEFGDKEVGKSHSILVDCKKAYEDLGFKTKYSIEDGLEKTISWFRSERSM